VSQSDNDTGKFATSSDLNCDYFAHTSRPGAEIKFDWCDGVSDPRSHRINKEDLVAPHLESIIWQRQLEIKKSSKATDITCINLGIPKALKEKY
jgi:hypothetical protein